VTTLDKTGRISTLDGLRGIAVMGILLMNISAFAMPFAAYGNPANYGTLAWPDIVMWAVGFVLVDGKMRAIFSALFGASLLLIADRSEAAGANPVRIHYARAATLLLIGLGHACLLWSGDILVLYAIVGMVAFQLRRMEIERMLVLAALLLAFQLVMLGIHYQGLAELADAATAPHAGTVTLEAWRDVLDTIGRPSPTSSRATSRSIMAHGARWSPILSRTSPMRWCRSSSSTAPRRWASCCSAWPDCAPGC
jgi:uncharacterized protein